MNVEVFEREGNLDPRIKDQYYAEVFSKCISLYEGATSPAGFFFDAVFGDFEGYEIYIYQRWNDEVRVQQDAYLTPDVFWHFVTKFTAEIEVAAKLFESVSIGKNGWAVFTEDQTVVIDEFEKKINPRFTLFDVDPGFQRIDIRDFSAGNDRKWFTALKLTTHEAEMRQVGSGRLRPLYEKIIDEFLAPQDRLAALKEFRKYIDFSFIHVSQDELDKVLEVSEKFQSEGWLKGDDELDYRITRQAEETMWKTKFLRMPQQDRNKLFHGIRVFERLYRKKFRLSESNSFASGHAEAAYNHILRSIDIVLGLVHAGEVNEGRVPDPFKSLINRLDLSNPDNLLELCLTVLVHDVIEDDLKTVDNKSVTPVWMKKVLKAGGLDEAMVDRVVNRSVIMNARVCMVGETADPNFDDGRPPYGVYLERLSKSDDPYILMAKFADIFQNSCSTHAKQLEKSDEKEILPYFSPKYFKKHITETVDFLRPYEEAFALLLGDKVKKKVKEFNPQLEFYSKFWQSVLGNPMDQVREATANNVIQMIRPVQRLEYQPIAT